MNLILDSCTIINLINGELLEEIVNMPGIRFYITPFVDDECSAVDTQKEMLIKLKNGGVLSLLDCNMTASHFKEGKAKFNLGDGETETILAGNITNYNIATDDKQARKCGVDLLGTDRVMGSLFLLREAVRAKILICEQAKQGYLFMKAKGGFLPKIHENYFCE